MNDSTVWPVLLYSTVWPLISYGQRIRSKRFLIMKLNTSYFSRERERERERKRESERERESGRESESERARARESERAREREREAPAAQSVVAEEGPPQLQGGGGLVRSHMERWRTYPSSDE